MKPIVSPRIAFTDDNLLGERFNGPSYIAMRSLILAALGEKLTDEERVHFTKLTRRAREPLQRVRKFIVVAGRRSAKSETAARLCIYQAILCDHRDHLSVGEKGVVLCVAQNLEQAKIVFGYCVGILQSQPILQKEVVNVTKESIVFKNGIEIQVRPASFRGLRGMTCVFVCADETCFWYQEENNSANSDSEIIRAVTPSLATTHGMLAIISSPYSRRGVVYKFYSRYFGPEGDPLTLVAQGASLDFNSTIDPEEIKAAYEEDYASACAEWGGQWRSDIEGYVALEALQACVIPQRYEVPPMPGRTYSCFIDASTGAGGDSFAAAIGHMRDDVLVVDAIRNFVPKFSPEAVVYEIAQLCKAYNVRKIHSDNYASGFVIELFNKHGIIQEVVEQNKSQIYITLLSVINSGKIELLDDPRSLQEIQNLERRVGFAGKDRIDHPVGLHDDSSNVIAGLSQIVTASGNFSLINYYRAYARPGTKPWKTLQEWEKQIKEEREQALKAQQESKNKKQKTGTDN